MSYEICTNFRDVGEYINLIADEKILPCNKLYRGGHINLVDNLEQINNPKTIINLRRGKDPEWPNVRMLQIATDNQLEVYQTEQGKVQRWLNEVIKVLQNETIPYPIFIHCTSGKDRTGVVIAALLTLLEIPQSIIVEEYMLSQGEVKRAWIEQALKGIAEKTDYFNKINITAIKSKLLYSS